MKSVRHGRPTSIIAASFLAVLATSCSPAPTESLFPVNGSLFVNNEPAAGAVVTFHRAGDPDKSNLPHAVVQKDGKFSLTTLVKGDGARPGRYQVTIIWRRKNKSAGDDDGGALALPIRYLTPEQSGLEVEINAAPTQLEPFRINS